MYKGEIESIDAGQQAGELPVIDCHCLQTCISHLKYRKASGYDGITNEHIIYADISPAEHLFARTSPPPRHQAPDISPARLRTFPHFLIHSFSWPRPQSQFECNTAAPAAALLYDY